MKRKRYLELQAVANDVCSLLIEKKVLPNEGCLIRRIAETQWDALRATHDEVRQSLSNQIGIAECETSCEPCGNEPPLSDNL